MSPMRESLLGSRSTARRGSTQSDESIAPSEPKVGRSSSMAVTRPSDKGGKAGGGARTLGTFGGVYIPCVNSIFGVVLFLRWGWAVGQIGISGALAVLLLGTIVSLITAAHVSALATNGQVEIGGAYFLLSRSLGPEFGGAVGLLFYVAQAFAVGLYVLGFAEAILPVINQSQLVSSWLPCQWDDSWCPIVGEGGQVWDKRAISVLLLLVLLTINLLGSDIFARVSTGIFVVVLFGVCSGLGSIVVYSAFPDTLDGSRLIAGNFTGLRAETFSANWAPDTCDESPPGTGEVTTFYVVGVILPAVTGLLNGASMSGNLIDPGHSIPVGTLYAVFTMVGVYASIICMQGASFKREELQNNYQALQDISWWPPAVLIATVFATFSPALTTMAGMSRILQAQAKDGLYGARVSRILAKGYGKSGEPRVCFLLSWFLGQLVCLFGEVNLAATFVTIFFFATYAALNFACAVLIVSGAPNFRPDFKYYNWVVSLCGVVLCLCIGFFVDVLIASISIMLAVSAFVAFTISSAGGARNFASISQALVYQWAHRYLLRLDPRKAHVKYWRPQVLVLLNDSADEEPFESPSSHSSRTGMKKGYLEVREGWQWTNANWVMYWGMLEDNGKLMLFEEAPMRDTATKDAPPLEPRHIITLTQMGRIRAIRVADGASVPDSSPVDRNHRRYSEQDARPRAALALNWAEFEMLGPRGERWHLRTKDAATRAMWLQSLKEIRRKCIPPQQHTPLIGVAHELRAASSGLLVVGKVMKGLVGVGPDRYGYAVRIYLRFILCTLALFESECNF